MVRANSSPLRDAIPQQRVNVVVALHEASKDAPDRNDALERFGGCTGRHSVRAEVI